MTSTSQVRSAPTKAPGVGRPARQAATTKPLRAASGLSLVTLVLMLAASVAGLLVDGLYRDPASTSAMLRGYDLVTLVVAVPALAVALVGVRHGSVRAQLVWLGLLAYAVYNYAIYVFGTAFSDIFLLHVALFACSLSALVLGLSGLDVAAVAQRFSPRTPVRWVSGLLAFMALTLGGMWIYYSLRFAVTGDMPEGSALVETDAIVHLGYVLDLALLIPAYGIAAVLLWRRAFWGYVLATALLVSSTLHQIGYLVALPYQVNDDVPGATAFDPAEPVIATAFLIATAVMLLNVRRSQRPGGAAPS